MSISTENSTTVLARDFLPFELSEDDIFSAARLVHEAMKHGWVGIQNGEKTEREMSRLTSMVMRECGAICESYDYMKAVTNGRKWQNRPWTVVPVETPKSVKAPASERKARKQLAEIVQTLLFPKGVDSKDRHLLMVGGILGVALSKAKIH